MNFKGCVGFVGYVLNHSLEETKYYQQDRKTLIKPYDPLICLTTKPNSHYDMSFPSSNVFSIFSVMHIYTPIPPTIFMKPDLP